MFKLGWGLEAGEGGWGRHECKTGGVGGWGGGSGKRPCNCLFCN